jgi:transcriptional regulator with XRE-family HTH domain
MSAHAAVQFSSASPSAHRPARRQRDHRRDEYQYRIGRRLQMAVEEIIARERITRTEFARRTHTTLSKLGNWIRGEHYPDPLFVWHLHEEFGVTADWLYLERIPGLPPSLRQRIAGAAGDNRSAAPAASRHKERTTE